MKVEVILSVILTLGIFGMSIKKLKAFKVDAKGLTKIGIMAAITIILYMIKLVPFPQRRWI